MPRDRKYGRVLVESGAIPEDEPVFLLRAKDRASLQTMIAYKAACLGVGAGTEHIARVDESVREFRRWRAANVRRMKVPD